MRKPMTGAMRKDLALLADRLSELDGGETS